MDRLYSFDIYDTLITRTVMEPTELFARVASRLSDTSARIGPPAYRRARIRAERRARHANRPRDACGFVDIFEHFPELESWGVPAELAMRAELEVERELSRPIRCNVERVRRLIHAGERVVFLSDMYLPGDFLWELIRRHVAVCERDQVLVSGDVGLAKHTGRLYRYLMEREGIAPAQLVHFGDNLHSDIRVARRLGITAIHYADATPTRAAMAPRVVRSLFRLLRFVRT